MRMKAFRLLKENKSRLSIQQYRTIKGQILKGDCIGAIRGIERIRDKRRKELDNDVRCTN